MELQAGIAEYREAIRLDPSLTTAHHWLGRAHWQMKNLDEAILELRLSSRLFPENGLVHYHLGIALRDKGYEARARRELKEATGEFREAIRRGFDPAQARFELAKLILFFDDPAGAAAEFHEVTRLKPGDLEAEFGEKVALPAFVTCKALRRLHPAPCRGADQHPQPNIGDDWQSMVRYNAAAAALAGCGKSKDAAPNELAKAKLRHQALDWLRSLLLAWSTQRQPQARSAILSDLQHWKKDSDLAGVGDPKSLANLSEAEQKAWYWRCGKSLISC